MTAHLHDFYRSSAAYRVRIVVNLKGVEAERTYVNLTKGEQRDPEFLKFSPSGLMPVFQHDGNTFYQSLAIIDYLDAKWREPRMVPADAAGRARVLGLSLAIAADTHPLTNVRVLNYVEKEMGAGKEGRAQWIEHWCRMCFSGLEERLSREAETGQFMHGDRPSLADVCLIPQLFFARRFDLDLSDYPTVLRIEETCQALPAFADAHPANQPDAV